MICMCVAILFEESCFILEDVLTGSSFEQQGSQQTTDIIDWLYNSPWNIFKSKSSKPEPFGNRKSVQYKPHLKIAMENGPFEDIFRIFPIRQWGVPASFDRFWRHTYHPSLSQFFHPDVVVVPVAGKACKEAPTRNATDWENSGHRNWQLKHMSKDNPTSKRESFPSYVSCFFSVRAAS